MSKTKLLILIIIIGLFIFFLTGCEKKKTIVLERGYRYIKQDTTNKVEYLIYDGE